ncbi:MOSC domain-containing protein [Paenarthrobacter aurescens]|uniref:MOSC domain-containing protein n=2 Tax=Paenarthrobacter aurescens TaxID=43663 RepID=A0A4Y3NFQ3_PAEAU|nr:MOSC domain-containing protein [Paenarthrobacter aurescens]
MAARVRTLVSMNTASLLAVCRVHQLLPDPQGNVGVTGMDKRPVEGPVKVHKLGLHGDVQANRVDHGGEDQALYAYSQADADYWSGELQREMPAGIFGENLRVTGIETTGAVIGERWRIGLDVELEVTSPRVPCATFQRVIGEPQWVKRFTQAGRVGAYLRVIKTGSVSAGDHVHRTFVPKHGVTVGQWFSEPSPELVQILLDAEADGEIRLQEDYHPVFEKVLRRNGL